jgi:hypothetical protein
MAELRWHKHRLVRLSPASAALGGLLVTLAALL